MTKTSMREGSTVDPYDVWLLAMNSLNIVLHLIGFFLLMARRHGEGDVQRVYLINLSITEFVKNLLILITVIPDVINIPDDMEHVINEAHTYIGIVYDYGVMCSFYLTMIFVTIDRYIYISWNEAYKKHWKHREAKCLMFLIWGIAVFISLVISLVYKLSGSKKGIKYFLYIDDTESLVIAYCRPFIDVPFLLLAIIVYYKIFCKFSQSHKRITAPRKQKQDSSIKIFIKSRFLITALLIVSFILFTFIPDMIFTYYAFTHHHISYQLEAICYILFAISDLSDAIIYIFIKHEVRKLLLQKLSRVPFCRHLAKNAFEMETSNTISVNCGHVPTAKTTLM